jgi:hypothetical protein
MTRNAQGPAPGRAPQPTSAAPLPHDAPSGHSVREPAPLAGAIAWVLELSDERDRYLARILAAERDGYARGYATGYDAGWLACIAELKRAQQDTYELIKASAPLWASHYKTLRDSA